jgi:hypothetical protein
MYYHCRRCLKEKPDDISPRDYAQMEVGATRRGIQIWCKRHEVNIAHIDFEGTKHPADMGNGDFD